MQDNQIKNNSTTKCQKTQKMFPQKHGRAKSLPVLMHHYVHNNHGNSITVPVEVFEEQCKGMAEHGWRGVSLAEAESFFLSGENLPPKSTLITFDDGYFDTYCVAMPLLYKYGHQGVMFMVADRAEKAQNPRVSIEEALLGKGIDYPNLHTPVRMDDLGLLTRHDMFCNTAELQAMDAQGTIKVAGHCMGHLGVFTGETYTEIAMPCNQGRTFYETNLGVIWGLPLFPIAPALGNKAFLPAPEMIEALTRFVPQNKADALAFFQDSQNIAATQQLIAGFTGKMGRYETDEEMRTRMEIEITEGKKKLEAILGHSIQTLCWPWGAYNDFSMQIAREANYKVFITTKQGTNPPREPLAVKRFKVRAKPAPWLLNRLAVYSRPWLGNMYAAMRM